MYWYKYLSANNLNEGESIDLLSSKYILKNNILRQNEVYSKQQNQTKEAFGFKWNKRETYESNTIHVNSQRWLKERYLRSEEDAELLKKWLPDGAKFLDVGCGSGFSAMLLFEKFINKINYLGVDISSAVDIAVKRFNENNIRGEFLQADILKLPFSGPTFDVIFSEGVLHHTDSTEKALKYLATLLIPGGRFMFYVYLKKGPIREYSDDFIRNHLSNMDDKQAWEALIPLTKLGKILGDLRLKVDIPEEIPFLGIPAGSIDLQRLFYWYVLKAYYKPEWTHDEMNHVNYDWYRPTNCYRHTPGEIRKWCNEAKLKIEHMDIQDSGITVVAIQN